ncbi:hypothetical protein [Nocardiopsis halophila]|uniref:hypothetical protein n=1 Tax=Nocardiopsis halophila TaxID=141692 RepID=UPI00034C988C|nr:hypothetical protein [Nocardiopsis halophila]
MLQNTPIPPADTAPATPEVTAAEVLAVRAHNAPADAVIALRLRDMRVVAMPAGDTRDWRGRELALAIASRTEVINALEPHDPADIGAVEALADRLTGHLAVLIAQEVLPRRGAEGAAA